jgi:hypothetical protein
MIVIMKVTRKSADLITYHLPVTSQKEGPPVVFVGCYLCCRYQAINIVLPLPLPPQSPGAFWGTPRLPGLCGAAIL